VIIYSQFWEMLNTLKVAVQMTENFGLLGQAPDRQ
jgi:hypothetical protein